MDVGDDAGFVCFGSVELLLRLADSCAQAQDVRRRQPRKHDEDDEKGNPYFLLGFRVPDTQQLTVFAKPPKVCVF